jgi:BASS family bile acid:Na+ symporter
MPPTAILNQIVFPIVLGLIFFGAGLALTVDDFKRILVYPKAVAIGFFGQLILVPIVGFIVVSLFLSGQPDLAAGLMIVLVCVGGSNSTLIQFLLAGDVALSITLSALTNAVTIFTIPFLANWSLKQFLGQDTPIQLNIPMTIMQLFVFTLLPMIIGMLIKWRAPQLAQRLERPVKILSAVGLAIAIIPATILQWGIISGGAVQVGVPVLVSNVVLMLVGLGVGMLARLPRNQQLCLGIEFGIQNGVLAIYIANALLQNQTMFVSALIYSILMLFSGLAFAWIVGRNIGGQPAAAAAKAQP